MSSARAAKTTFSCGVLLVAAVVSAQSYPNKPVRVLANPIGGAPDFAARLVAPALSARLGQPVIVDNRRAPVAIEAAAKAPPDGYTIVITGSALWLLPFLRANVPWDPVRDFSPITVATSSPTLLVVHPALAASSVKELIALAKAKPGALNYGSTATGTLPHIAAELFKAMTGVNLTRVAYKGAGQALIAIAGGEVQTAFATTSSAMPHVRAERLRALAVTSATPSVLVPGLPTVAATVPGYEAVSIIAVFVPARTPEAIAKRLNLELARILGTAEARERFFNTGVEAIGGSPAQLAATVKSEMARLGRVIHDAGIREE